MQEFSSPSGSLNLGRHPYDDTPNLQAWNAADELLLAKALQLPRQQGRVLVFNDTFGALALGLMLQGFQVVSVTDSSLSQRAFLTNLGANGLEEASAELKTSLWIPEGDFDGIFMKLPKSLAFLEWQLWSLKNIRAPLWAGGMTKDVHSSTVKTFESYRSGVVTTLAAKKARLILADQPVQGPAPSFPKEWSLPALDVKVMSHAAVFSSQGLDAGTELLLRCFPRMDQVSKVIDLGCGTGLLGLAAARAFPEAEVFLVDESFMAVWSARQTFLLNGLGSRGVFLTGDGLEDFSSGFADLILCNPPFHFQNSQTQEVARRMIRQARRVLKAGGQLWLVANAHLGYHVELKNLFRDVRVGARNEKFVVYRASVPADGDGLHIGGGP